MLRGRSMRRLLLRPRCRRSRRWGSRRRRAVVVVVGAAAASRVARGRCFRRRCCRPPRPPRLRRCAAAARGARAAWPVGARLSEFYVISPLRGDPECLSWHGVTRLNLFFSAVRGSSPCAPVRCCAAERPVDLAWAAPNSCARAGRFPPGGIRARREPATPPGPPSLLGRCAPAFVWLRTSAWRLHRGARGCRVAGAPSAPSYGAAAVLHFCR